MATTALRHNFCTVAPMGHNFSLFFTIFKTHFFIFFYFFLVFHLFFIFFFFSLIFLVYCLGTPKFIVNQV